VPGRRPGRARGPLRAAGVARQLSASPPLVAIGGPTATGKTGLSIRLAELLAGSGVAAEIISADSRQVYRGLDIGTAKVSPTDRARVPHHGLDLVDPAEPFSVVDFVEHATGALAGIAARGGVALLVGGTGLYLRALGRGMATDDLPHDPAARADIEADLEREGLDALADRLGHLAPRLAARTDLANPRRVVRALEMATLRGDAPLPKARGYGGPILWLGLDLADRATHRRWIAERAHGQFAAGLVGEADSLRRRYDPGLPCFSAIGYREAWSVIDGRVTLEEAVAMDAQRSVAFARRQRTWFRGEPDIEWCDATTDPLAAIRDRVGRFLDAAGLS
jgi:tRNA dimethylallyltransferase